MKTNIRAAAAAAFLLFASTSWALVQPLKINFQGKLTDPSTNNPQTGLKTLTFKIYNVPTAGTALYTETQANVPLTNGVFTVQIGTTTALFRDLFLGASAYLGVTVSGDAGGEMSPRQQLVMSPYAFTANQLSDLTEVRLIADQTYSTFTNAGNLTLPGGLQASSGSFTNGVTASTATLLGNAFTIGGSSFVVSAGSVGIGVAAPAKMLDVNGAAQFGSTGKSAFDAAGNLTLASGADLSVTGAAGFITGQSSVTASAFFGDGSGLTGTGLISSPTVYNTAGTFTWFKNARNPNYVVIEVIGAGGGGGGVGATLSGASGGGGGGGYSMRRTSATALGATETVTVASGGGGGTGNAAGTAATATSFGTWVIANGGSGGATSGAGGTTVLATAGGAGGTAGVGDVTMPGAPGQPGIRLSGTIASSGNGGDSARGGGGGQGNVTGTAGANGSSYGGGGAGAATLANTARNGGTGATGLVIVWEYK